jgi:hypothetical protein
MTKLLKELDTLIEAFPRHYTAVQDRDAVAQMIQRDCWTQFSVKMNQLRQKIRCEIEKEKEATTEESSAVQKEVQQ